MDLEMLLVAVTLVSLALATSLAAIAWKLMRDHRRFAAARVDALVALVGSAEPAASFAPSTPVESLAPAAPRLTAETSQPTGRRWSLAMTMAGLAVVTVATALYIANGTESSFLSTVLRAASGAEAPSTATPLELRTLQYAADDAGTFTVSGVVANPANGRTLEDIVAVVYLFDEAGVCITSGRVALDVTMLHPGEQSGFDLRLAATTPVRRYRVGFRLSDGDTVPHVDKRPGAGSP